MRLAVVLALVGGGFAAGPTGSATGAATFDRFYAGGAVFPSTMVMGPDGAVWFAWEDGLGRVALDGSVRLHRIAGVDPEGLTVGHDGALWFVDPSRHQVGRFTRTGGVSLIPVRDGTTGRLGGIARGPDGTFWLANLDAGRIERLATDGTATVVAQLPNSSDGEDPEPRSVLPAANGDVWFGGSDLGVGWVSAQGEVRIVHPSAVVTEVQGLAAAPDGTVWSIASLSQEVAHIGQGGVLARVRAELTLLETIAVGADGAPWFGDDRGITRLDPDSLRRQSFGDPFGSTTDCGPFESQNLTPSGMAFSRDGALWVSDFGNGSLLRIGPPGRARSPLSILLPSRRPYGRAHDLINGGAGTTWVAGKRSLIALRRKRRPRVHSVHGHVGALVLGPAQRPWFALDHAIVELTDRGTVRTLARLPATAIVTAMTRGPDGAFWFTDFGRRRVGRVSRAGVVRYVTPKLGRRARLRDITLGSDRALWVTDSSGAIHRVQIDGRVRTFRVRRGGDPLAITKGPDGAVWFTEFNRRRVGRMSTRGRITRFRLQDRPVAIAAGSDGALWVTTTGVSGKNGLDRISTQGRVRHIGIRKACSGAVQGLLNAKDGSLLFTEDNGPAAVGRLDIARLRRTGQLTGN